MEFQRKPFLLFPEKNQGPLPLSLIQAAIRGALSWCTRVCKTAIGNIKTLFIKTSNTKQPPIIFLLGPPGAGKGTQVSLLKESFPELSFISYGDLVRREDRIPGSFVSSLPRRGGGSKSPILPPTAAVHILRQEIFPCNQEYNNNKSSNAGDSKSKNCDKMIWLIDGFPRTGKHVEAWIRGGMFHAQCVIYLCCPIHLSIDRVLARASTSGRPDDANFDLVRERVERNVSERDAMFVALLDHGMPFVKVDGTQDVETVRRVIYDTVMDALNTWNQSK
ncbi:P-loop containing nucleoside triphosphate hydrolase protein [Xylariaceae sp. FL0594]|nr:P-loop containing nucleoside triphosphate hydrolase protein [Xylariaceae sp. FL0594]